MSDPAEYLVSTSYDWTESSNAQYANYFTFRFKTPVRIASVRFADYQINGQNYTGTIEVRGSNDNATWTRIAIGAATGQAATETSEWVPSRTGSLTIASDALWEYIRIDGYDNDVGICETLTAIEIGISAITLTAITGTVTDIIANNAPIAGATVAIGEYSGTTDANGEFSFDAVVATGSYTITCTAARYMTVAVPRDIIQGTGFERNFSLWKARRYGGFESPR